MIVSKAINMGGNEGIVIPKQIIKSNVYKKFYILSQSVFLSIYFSVQFAVLILVSFMLTLRTTFP